MAKVCAPSGEITSAGLLAIVDAELEHRRMKRRQKEARRDANRRARDPHHEAAKKRRQRARQSFEQRRATRRRDAEYWQKRRKREYMKKYFVALDGEGITRDDGAHDYVLLGCSDGRTLEQWETGGISTRDCLDFIMDVAREHENGIFVGFAFGYDCNMILRDVHDNHLELLQDGEEIIFDGTYKIRYFPGKSLYIGRGEWTKQGFQVQQSLTVWDVWGFFQSSFVAALEEWKIGAPEIVAEIKAMKVARGDFANESRDDIRGYCLRECVLLTELMQQVFDILGAVDLQLSRWDGAGAVAAALLRQRKIKDYIRAPKQDVKTVCMNAYFGGRVETFGVGVVTEQAYAYDINSAYPYAATHLPSMEGNWYHVAKYYPDDPYAIWRVRWQMPDRTNLHIAPLPFREQGGDIYWASRGEGWYHAIELNAARETVPADYEIIEGWVFEPKTNTRPFDWVPEVYAERLKYKAVNDPRHIILKLGLNAMYGKLAQGVGMFNRAPAFQSYYWAGYITAFTRAQLLRALKTVPDYNAIFAATDGIFTRVPLPLETTKALGGWDKKEVNAGMVVVQPGVIITPSVCDVHRRPEPSCENCRGRHMRSRGFSRDALDYDAFVEAWRDKQILAKVSIEETRFWGMGRALQENMTNWRRWITETREVGFITLPKKNISADPAREYPPAKFPAFYEHDGSIAWWPLYPVECEGISAPYTPKKVQVAQDRLKAEQDAIEQPDLTPGLWP